MVESRCGILCSACKFREKMNCQGCVAIDKPYWGECQVKSCCEGKGYNNCGECPELPCETLTQFAYDEHNGDAGRRIERCKEWASLR